MGNLMTTDRNPPDLDAPVNNVPPRESDSGAGSEPVAVSASEQFRQEILAPTAGRSSLSAWVSRAQDKC